MSFVSLDIQCLKERVYFFASTIIIIKTLCVLTRRNQINCLLSVLKGDDDLPHSLFMKKNDSILHGCFRV